MRAFHSVMSEGEYQDPVGLQEFREEFDEMLRRLLEDEMNRTKTVDYKASFHILRNRRHSSMGDDEEESLQYSSSRRQLKMSSSGRESTGVIVV